MGKPAPKGYKDEHEFLEEARRRFQEAVDADGENRKEALEDLKFLAGEQWDESARNSRKGRPCLIINRLPQFVAQVVGDIRINRPAIKVRPAEDADKDLADVREGLIRSIERQSDAQGVYATTGQAQVACGIGNFRVALKYASDDGFDRDIAIERIPNPFAVVWDPLSIEPTGKDARYAFVQDEWNRLEFEKAHPDDKPSDLIVSGDKQGWVTRDTVRVTEYWMLKETPVELVMLKDGTVYDPTAKPAEGEPPIPAPDPAKVKDRRIVKRKTVCMWLINGHAILDGPYELPLDRIPLFRAQGWEINVADKRVRWGLVRFAKDPQRLMNYWRSTSAEVIAMAPKGKWLAHVNAVTEEREAAFRAAAQSADPLLLYEGQNVPQWMNPAPVPTALLQEAALNSQDMKDVTGLQDASLGVKSNETSGKAIMARQREGDVATYIYHDNLQAAIAEGGRVINQLIPIVYDTARTIRVVGEDDAVKVQRINDPNHPESIDINKGKYDVVVETGPSYSTKRVEAAESMMQFVQAVPAAAQVAADLIAKAMDWPNAEIIGERLKKTIPPQLLEGEDGEEPKQPDPAQMQQMQMQQEAQMGALKYEMQTHEANAEKAHWDAERAKAEAITAMAEAGLPLPEGVVRAPMKVLDAMHAMEQDHQANDFQAQQMQQAQAAQEQQHALKAQAAQANQIGRGSPTSEEPATDEMAA